MTEMVIQTVEPALLTVRQAAIALGVSRHTVRLWTLKGTIATVRVGARALRIPVEEIHARIAAGYRPAVERTSNHAEDK